LCKCVRQLRPVRRARRGVTAAARVRLGGAGNGAAGGPRAAPACAADRRRAVSTSRERLLLLCTVLALRLGARGQDYVLPPVAGRTVFVCFGCCRLLISLLMV